MESQLLNYMKIKKIFLNHWVIGLILVLAAVLRLWNLGINPPHLTPDEAALGYNAYSIGKTGRDEFGKLLPVVFKSFGDYKPGFYIYLTVPSVAVFGLTEFATRLPSALAGVVTVLLIYLIVKELFGIDNAKKIKLEILAAVVAATNPWLIFFSRGAWEVNLSLTLTLFGVYFFLRSLKNSKFIIFSGLSFALTLITYQGAKISTGIILLILSFVYYRDIIRFNKKDVISALVLGFIVSIPILISLVNGQTGRLNVFSVFSYPRPKEYLQAMLDEGGEKVGDLNYFLFHPESLNFFRGIMGRWFNHFSGRFLFFEGDWSNPRHSSPNQGVLLFSDLILLLIGVSALVKYGTKKQNQIIWLWLTISPFASALSRDQVHAVRSLGMVVPLVLIASVGLQHLLLFANSQKKIITKYILLFSFGCAFTFSFVYYLDSYFVHLPVHDSNYWEYGYKQMVETIKPIQNNYKNIKVQQSFAQPYIFFLFYGGDGSNGGPKNGQGYDPAKYQKDANWVTSENAADVGYVVKLDNICFCAIDWSVNRGDHGVLFVADPLRIPPLDSNDPNQFILISDIKYLNGRDTAFRILQVK